MFEILNYIFAIGINVSHIIGYVISIFAFLFIYKHWEYLKKEKIILFMCVFLVYGFVWSCFCEYKENAFEEMFTYLTSWLFPFILGYITCSNKKEKIIKIYVTTFLIIILFSVLSYYGLFYESVFGSRLAVKGEHLCGFIWHISCGAICVLISCFTMVSLLFNNSLLKKQKIILSVLTIFFIICLYLTGSRGYYIAGAITYLLILAFYIYKTKKIKIPLFIFCASIIIIIPLLINNPYMVQRIANTSVTKEWSLTNRIDSYKSGLKIFKKHFIFGVGPKQSVKQQEFYDTMNFQKNDNSVHLHSMYLNIISDLGSIGFILFFGIIFFVIKKLILKYKNENSILALCLLFAWCSLLIGDMFDTVMRGPRVSMEYFWLTGLILSNISCTNHDKKN